MCIVDNKIPVIHTLKSDMQQFSNNNEASPVMAAQQQLDQRLIPAVDDTLHLNGKFCLELC